MLVLTPMTIYPHNNSGLVVQLEDYYYQCNRLELP